jgi:hypothetical protein
MNKLRLFQYALLGLVLSPVVGMIAYGAYAQSVNSTGLSTSKGGTTNVTVTTPPNDVVAGPTSLNSIGNVPVSAMGTGSTGIDIRGTFTGMTALFEGSVDGTNFVTIPCVVPLTGAIVTGATAAGTWTCQSAGYQIVRARLSAIATGTAVITLNASAGSNQPPIGTQGTATNITAVGGNAVTTTVPVSGTVTASIAQPTNIDTAEVMWINFTGTAAASGTASYPLAPATATTFVGLNSFASPQGFAINTALSVVAATTAHKFSCTVW